MQKIDHIDNQMLSAFVDGELDIAHSAAIIEAMASDADVRDRVNNLRRAKDLMKLGFGHANAPSDQGRPATISRWKKYSRGLAATVAAIGIGAGIIGYNLGKPLPEYDALAVAPAAIEQIDRIILHINEADPGQFVTALDYAEEFIKEHEARGGEIAVVAHSTGIDLMRTGVSPYEDRVRTMIENHDNVYFIACANAIRALKKKGIEPEFIDQVDTRKPAMDQIIEHVEAGWKYIKVKALLSET